MNVAILSSVIGGSAVLVASVLAVALRHLRSSLKEIRSLDVKFTGQGKASDEKFTGQGDLRKEVHEGFREQGERLARIEGMLAVLLPGRSDHSTEAAEAA